MYEWKKPNPRDYIIKLDDQRELIVVVKQTGRVLSGAEKDLALKSIMALAEERGEEKGGKR